MISIFQNQKFEKWKKKNKKIKRRKQERKNDLSPWKMWSNGIRHPFPSINTPAVLWENEEMNNNKKSEQNCYKY